MSLTMEGMLHGSVQLPLSKSESNRALMIAAYLFGTENGKRNGVSPHRPKGGKTEKGSFSVLRFPFSVSEAHDTVLLQALLKKIFAASHDRSDAVQVDCEDAGTVARFLLPFLAGREGTWLVTGTERLCQRPMRPLVEALRQLGADIVYLGKEGLLPLRVQGRPLRGGALTLDATQSSQFASALLLAAPMWEQGLTLRLEGPVASKPYLDMTLAMMRQAGAEVLHHGPIIEVAPKPYREVPFEVGADWSAASYWYELLALSKGGSLMLEGLHPSSLQGDAVVAGWFRHLGVHTRFEPQGAVLTKVAMESEPLQFDFSATPDLFPAVFVTCVALHLPSEFTGIRNLSLKESDRVHALMSELSKLYTFINIIEDYKIIIEPSRLLNNEQNDSVVLIDTHYDHRIAMALAPLKTRFPRIEISHPEVVDKSYPNYWTDFETVIG